MRKFRRLFKTYDVPADGGDPVGVFMSDLVLLKFPWELVHWQVVPVYGEFSCDPSGYRIFTEWHIPAQYPSCDWLEE